VLKVVGATAVIDLPLHTTPYYYYPQLKILLLRRFSTPFFILLLEMGFTYHLFCPSLFFSSSSL